MDTADFSLIDNINKYKDMGILDCVEMFLFIKI